MDLQKTVFKMISEFSGNKNILAIPRILIDYFDGDYPVILIFAQLLYWSPRTDDPKGWIYKSAADWKGEIGLSKKQVKRVNEIFEKKDFTLIDTKVEYVAHRGSSITHYRINQEVFLAEMTAFLSGEGNETDEAEREPSEKSPCPKVTVEGDERAPSESAQREPSYTAETTTEITQSPHCGSSEDSPPWGWLFKKNWGEKRKQTARIFLNAVREVVDGSIDWGTKKDYCSLLESLAAFDLTEDLGKRLINAVKWHARNRKVPVTSAWEVFDILFVYSKCEFQGKVLKQAFLFCQSSEVYRGWTAPRLFRRNIDTILSHIGGIKQRY